MAAKRRTIVPTVEELKARDAILANKTPAAGSSEPFYVNVPEAPTGENPPEAEPSVVKPRASEVTVELLGSGTGIATPPEPTNQTLSPRPRKRTVGDILEEAGIDPTEELIEMYNRRIEDPNSPDHGKFAMSQSERVSIMRELLKYQHPTLKAVEHTGNTEDNRIVVVLQMPDGSRTQQHVESRGKVTDA